LGIEVDVIEEDLTDMPLAYAVTAFDVQEPDR
jgi:hypothetical protein